MDQLTLHNVTVADAGWYTCVVSNRYGQRQQSSWIEVLKANQSALDAGRTSSSVHVLVLVVVIIAFSLLAAAAVIVAVCWQRHRPPKSRPLVLKENSIYFQPLNLPVDPEWEISRYQ